jgi:regulator of protease activity HflC (stomatin/prohibitin superfamily)
MGFAFIALVVAIVVVASVLFSAIKVVKEYERGVIFRLGRVQGGPKGPGLFLLFPLVDMMVKIDLRTVTMDVPPQDVITRDNVPARVNAVVYEAERLYEEAVGEVSPQASPDEVRPER